MESPRKRMRCGNGDLPSVEGSAEADAPQNLFAGVCDEAMAIIAQYAPPPDVYHLCLASKRFFDRKSGDALGSRLLRTSLTSSLRRVLRKSGLTADQIELFSEMASSLPPDSVVISGSVIVQAALGETWEGSDVDIYCTAVAAPAVRSWLIRDANKMIVNAGKTYDPLAVEKSDDLYFRDSIHHVEGYGNVPEEGTTVRPGMREEHFNYEKLCETGKSINERLTNRRHIGTLRTFGDDFQTAPYRIETTQNVPLPFCLAQECGEYKVIDLIVCIAEHTSAKAAIEDFDITMCKCAWNGSSFSIVDPHNTFKRRSTISPTKRKDFLASYKHHYNSGAFTQIGQTLNAVKRDGIELPAPLLPKHPAKERRARNNELHNYAVATFQRIEKYGMRGIAFGDNFTEVTGRFRGRHILT